MQYAIPSERHPQLARGLWVAALTAAYMTAVGGEIPVYEDTIQDMLCARDGMVFGVFESGSGTTFDPIKQAELWPRFLAITFALGLGVVGQQWITTVLAALSIALFDHGARKHFGDDIGWAPAGVLLPVMLVAIVYPIATAGYLAAPVLVASTLALLYVVTSGSTLAACLAGASLAFTAELHPVTLLGVPVFVLTVLLSCHRPIRALSVGIASGIVAALSMSFNAWFRNAKSIIQEPWLLALVAGALAVAILIASRARPRWLGLDVQQRRDVLLLGILGTITAELTVASAIGQRMFFMPHYFLFGFPALAILVALGLRRLRTAGGLGRRAAVAIPVTLLSLHLLVTATWKYGLATGTVSTPSYLMREAETLARHFWASGYSFPDVQRHLRGPNSLELMGALSVFAPSPDGSMERPIADLRVVAFAEPNRPDGSIPAGGEELDLGRGRRAWILPLDGWVGLAPSRVCFETVEGRPDCIAIDSASIEYNGRYRGLYQRSFPALRELSRRIDGQSAQAFTWELPIEITGDDQERHFDLVGLVTAPWMIVRVEGVSYRGDLPARHVVLARGGELSGRIVLAPASSSMTLKHYPPDFLETRPEETAIRRSIQQLPPLGRFLCESQGTCPDSAPG